MAVSMIFDRFKHKRDPSLQYADGLDGRPFRREGAPEITVPRRNGNGKPAQDKDKQ